MTPLFLHLTARPRHGKRRRRRTVLAGLAPLLTVLVVAPNASGQATSPTATRPEAASWTESDPGPVFLRDLERRHSRLETLAADFRQVTRSPLLLGAIHTTGTFHYLAPDRFRSDAVSQAEGAEKGPVETIAWSEEGTSLVFLPKTEQATRRQWDVSDPRVRHINHMLLGFVARSEETLRIYDVQLLDPPATGVTRLKLRPWYLEEMGGLRELLLDFDLTTHYPQRVFAKHEGGEETEIEIRNVRANIPIDDEYMTVFLPWDARVLTFR